MAYAPKNFLKHLADSDILLTFANDKKVDSMEDSGVWSAQEPVASHMNTSYADVMHYLHTIDMSQEDRKKVASRLTLETTGENFLRVYGRLSHLSGLQQDWDGHGALPVSRKVTGNVRQVLAISDDADWKNWALSPGTNATLYLVSKSKRASISLGENEFSYYARKDGKDIGENHLPFSPGLLLSVMQRLSK